LWGLGEESAYAVADSGLAEAQYGAVGGRPAFRFVGGQCGAGKGSGGEVPVVGGGGRGLGIPPG
jgi:hypothetical protein